MMRFEGKTAIVTGAATGIGAAITTLLAMEGAVVFAADIDGDALRHSDRNIRNHVCDVTSSSQVSAMVQTVVDAHGHIDLLFNNAGTGTIGDVTQTTDEDWDRVFKINVSAIMYACRAAIPHMRRTGGGAIVNTASVSGLAADHGFGAYNASKAAVINYTRVLALDHARENIRVNSFCPGFIANTRLTGGLEGLPVRKHFNDLIPMGRSGTAAEMAEVAAFLASEQASYVTGANIIADGGLAAHTGQPDMLAVMREISGGAAVTPGADVQQRRSPAAA
ncbi:SDR family NAD(P)-dependent oxidoreductase [Sphingobium sp. CR2-8]|uniref:SDR family NAD(P)-dependent oxidoreductase n=1 Tax=Sphingobium sp. CR2-8 TaxID=1306534 RepID=UPI002DB65F40|nr:SDR family NAD(P)-dependent oxidoreductase [Sphingobium sp. CR2-8]MEC3909219.1 SDR family NAD(P)-dependent oxidoreductase [Sphingobium sp. CR2-8]